MSVKIKIKEKNLIIDISDLKKNVDNIIIILPKKYRHIQNVNWNSKVILLIKKIMEGKFLELDADEYNNKLEQKIKIRKHLTPVSAKKFYELDPIDWKPKHLVQYVKYKFRLRYGKLSLELDWEDSGMISPLNSKQRLKCWAYAVSLFNRFDKSNISRRRLKNYVDWSFEYQKVIVITMPLLACVNWIDAYNFTNKNKRIDYVTDTHLMKRSEHWENTVKELKKGHIDD